MATTKKKRKKTGMINLTTLRRLAKKAFGKDAQVEEHRDIYSELWCVTTQGEQGVGVEHLNRATARRMLKAALEAALKG